MLLLKIDQRQPEQAMQKDRVKSHNERKKEGGEDCRRGKSNRLDLEYVELRDQIVQSTFYQQLEKIMKIRIHGWIQAMDAIIVNPIWKKNRNNFAKLLDLMCQCQVLVAPFSQPAPKNGLPNISKHQVNAVIDHVELQVKISTKNASTPKEEALKEVMETPKQHWSKVRMLKDQSRSSLEESSAFMGRFIDIIQKSNEASQITNQKYAQPKESDLFTFNKENYIPFQAQSMKKIKNKQINLFRKDIDSKCHPKLKIKEQKTPPSYFPKNMRVKTDITDSQPPQMFRNQHQSIDITNETLNTNSLDQEYIDYDISEISQRTCSDRTEQNFLEGLTQRNLSNDPIIRVEESFNKTKIPLSGQKLPVKQISLVSSPKPHEVNKSIKQDLDVSQSENVSNPNSTHIHLESIIDANSIAESQQRRIQRKLYWQSNSLSYDFQYKQNEHIQIEDEEEDEEESCTIGQEGSTNILSDSKIGKNN